MFGSSLVQIATELHTLTATDAISIATLAVLEGILSVDNSLVLAILVRGLDKRQQRKALSYGILGAFFFRFVALVFAAHLMRFVIFKLVGGIYLVYLAMKHMFFFIKEDAHKSGPSTATSFWKTIVMVELTDIAFSIDSITAAVAMSNKLLVVWAGGVLGIVFLRFAANAFIVLLEKLPRMEDLAYQLIFFIGTKLLLEGFHIEIGHATFWMMMGVIATLGASLVYRDYHQRQTHTRFQNQLLDQLRRNEIAVEEICRQEYIHRDILLHLQESGVLRSARPPGGNDPDRS